MRFIPLLLLVLSCCETLAAQQKYTGVRVDDRQMSLTYYSEPLRSDAKLLPFIEGRRQGGTGEPFGILLGTIDPATPVLELRNGNTVLKTLTIDNLLDRARTGGVTVRRERPPFNPRRSETVYTMQLSQGQAELLVTGLAAGDDRGGTPPQMIVTFAVKTASRTSMSLRLTLPVVGSAESNEHGFTLFSSAGNASIAGSVYPATRTITVTGKKLSVTSGPTDVGDGEVTPLLWMVLHGVTGASPAQVRAQSLEKLSKTHFGANDPHIAVVSAADRESSQPSDTVTYFLTCANIGTGEARDIVLKNPIPAGASYVDKSATSGGATLSFEKSASARAGEVQLIKWSFPQAFRPGEEHTVRFMVIVR